MKLLICYFSGTGNTKKVVELAKEEFEKLGGQVDLHSVDKNFEGDLNSYDMLGFAYPIHAFNAPSIVLNFAKSLKKIENAKKPLFIFKTSGEPLYLNNISSSKLKSILKKKGFILNNEYHYCMPYNIIFRHSDAMAYKMWDRASKVIPIDCKEIFEGKKAKLKYFPCSRLLAWIFRIEHWGGRFNGRRYKVSDKCIKCGKCVRNCPVGNITIENGEFKFGKNCLMCMRCSFFCPTNAIKIGFFDGWKVNGEYNFSNPDGAENEHKRYCKNSYKKYFRRMEEKILNKSEKND